ncbi:helix-turn-helix transcriptional regulator [Oscillatoria sp. CS-180]|uniref:helix-turn-helix domain-containing protein n=1 Tax=Oscillatoria sp. CS-180 TaxID=3021720 RepID=UPI00232C83DE|nr:helix-turn-helix transcriptional regulator [Oscillatoria sp. CS-180]MDB9524895.1 helix-turn-helix transcriptional regulator [Oscillatoria sp. CS-180]
MLDKTGSSESSTDRLKTLMAAVGVQSFRALAQKAEVSEWAVRQLRHDRITQMRIETLHKLAAALDLSLPELLQVFGVVDDSLDGSEVAAIGQAEDQRDRISTLEAEYQRLQTQHEQQESLLQERFQKEVLAAIETWLLQWPTIAHAVEKNPDLPASRLVPIVQPVQDLLAHWGIEMIASVGAEIPYDPQQHQLMDGAAEPGDLVRVRYTGFRQGTHLLYRAKVSPVG